MIEPMKFKHAQQISTWKYEKEYSIYSFQQNEETLTELMNGDYFVFQDENNLLSGYFCFGKSARIPTVEEEAYELEILDFGLGLKPCLCGKGLGGYFVRSGLVYAKTNFHVQQIRLSVASFNTRAINVYEKSGFQLIKTITHLKTKRQFHLMHYSFR